MGVQDLFVTPIYLILFTLIAYFLRPKLTNKHTRKYFMPALWVRFLGAIFLGLIYQFYYDGGDTFNYFTHGSKWIWRAFSEDFILGLKLLLEAGGAREPETFQYSQHIWYYQDERSFTIVRLVSFFDLFTFHTYSASALFFSVFSFSGLWAMYTAFHKRYPTSKHLHIAILFVPSVIFWGSGILKDTITLGALGWATWALFHFSLLKKKRMVSFFVGVPMLLLVLKIKSYIVLCFVPVVFLLLYLQYIKKIQNQVLKAVYIPFLLLFFGFMGFLAVTYASTDEYNIDNVAQRAAITAYDIRYGWGARTNGDGGYDIGIPDGTWSSIVRLMPAAINVSLFRPYLWEVKNPLMLLSALEALIIFTLSMRMIFFKGFKQALKDPFLVFCLVFSLFFAVAVGISTGNFGTLMRYKIPMIPFFATFLIVKTRA